MDKCVKGWCVRVDMGYDDKSEETLAGLIGGAIFGGVVAGVAGAVIGAVVGSIFGGSGNDY